MFNLLKCKLKRVLIERPTREGQDSMRGHGGQIHQDLISHLDPIGRQVAIIWLPGWNIRVKDSKGAVGGEDFKGVVGVDIDDYSIAQVGIIFDHFSNQINGQLYEVIIILLI